MSKEITKIALPSNTWVMTAAVPPTLEDWVRDLTLHLREKMTRPNATPRAGRKSRNTIYLVTPWSLPTLVQLFLAFNHLLLGGRAKLHLLHDKPHAPHPVFNGEVFVPSVHRPRDERPYIYAYYANTLSFLAQGNWILEQYGGSFLRLRLDIWLYLA